MKTSAEPKPCRYCGLPVTRRPGQLSTTIHVRCSNIMRGNVKGAENRAENRAQARTVPAYKLVRPVSRHGVTVPRVDIAKGNHRDRKLLDLAHEVHECTNCSAWVAEGCEPAHANGSFAGKGLGIKSGDGFHAALCPKCHSWLDQPIGLTRDPSGRYWSVEDEKLEMWTAAYFKTMTIYWRNGWLRVAA